MKDTLNSLLAMPKLVFNNLNKIETWDSIYRKLGSPHSKIQQGGVYIFTCITTGQKYVGSSNQLAFRLKGYFNQTHINTGKLIPLIKELGLSYYPEFSGFAYRNSIRTTLFIRFFF